MTDRHEQSSAGSGPVKNTDREIYHTPYNSVHDDSIHVTEGGGIGEGASKTCNSYLERALKAEAALAALQSCSAGNEDVRWAVNYLLEQIAAKFEAWETFDLFRSEAAATVRSFKHDLSRNVGSDVPIPDNSSHPLNKPQASAGNGDAFETYRETTRKVAAAREKGYAAALENLKEAWSALAMIREAVEALAPSGSVKAAEHLDGPTFMHEAEALVAGIKALTSTEPQAVPTSDDVVNFNGRLVTWADIEIAVRGRNAALSRPIHCPNGIEHGACLHPECVPSCPGRLALSRPQSRPESA